MGDSSHSVNPSASDVCPSICLSIHMQCYRSRDQATWLDVLNENAHVTCKFK